jgi:FkbM family methyltransferase
MLRFNCFCFCLLHASAFLTPADRQKPIVNEATPAAKSLLHQQRQTQNGTFNATFRMAEAPKCSCQVSNPAWKKSTRTSPKCIFIDLGAANGNTFESFLNNGYGEVKNCAHMTGDYEAFLVEANPRFQPALKRIEASNAKVHAFPSTAAYMCDGHTSFYLDTVNTNKNYWGSSMSANHQDTKASGLTWVTVPTLNLNKLLYENTIPDDWVMVKMDIEGAEWDIMPCLAKSSIASNIDRLFLEQHPSQWAIEMPNAEESVMNNAKAALKSKGVDIPGYFSQTF